MFEEGENSHNLTEPRIVSGGHHVIDDKVMKDRYAVWMGNGMLRIPRRDDIAAIWRLEKMRGWCELELDSYCSSRQKNRCKEYRERIYV